ncbi:hypothetical protein MAIT1_02078 [Magnetofaba australis IT-1]|uniref:Uncharacterized protein n=2 Tax=Magnetofaba TaxID=1472292 RepID=A0A1Y2K4S7_9PROT|nr:hypothetical protein MAIT1_02078 [Magnetofaba australis IT-1]
MARPLGEMSRKRLMRLMARLTGAQGGGRYERVCDMASASGQEAIASLLPESAGLAALGSRHDRALWVYLNEPALFRRAEQTLLMEMARYGQFWRGYAAPQGVDVEANALGRMGFESRVGRLFENGDAYLELYGRRAGEEGDWVTQAALYRSSGNGAERAPVLEAVILYDARSGMLEIIAMAPPRAEVIAALFAETLLNAKRALAPLWRQQGIRDGAWVAPAHRAFPVRGAMGWCDEEGWRPVDTPAARAANEARWRALAH